MQQPGRCEWAKDELEIAYHDEEWCRPQHDDRKLFEMLVLEGMQAGLSWNLILRRRESMRAAFDGFDPALIAGYDEHKQAELLQDAGIIRNRAKIRALVGNARAFLEVQREYGSFDAFLWGFTGGKTIQNNLRRQEDTPAETELSGQLSEALRKRGFRFVGPTICYSYMQAVGMVNDHVYGCPLYAECGGR